MAEAVRDFKLIFDHLFESLLGFRDSVELAIDQCEARIQNILQEADRLGEAHFGGESHDDLLPSLRHLIIDRATYWFDVNGAGQQLRVLASFSMAMVTSAKCWPGSFRPEATA